jgi:ESF2/ABP1 family protein
MLSTYLPEYLLRGIKVAVTYHCDPHSNHLLPSGDFFPAGKNFTEGWVEFQDKAVAKQVAGALNGQQMGGKRRSAYHFDLWAMKYLPKFKWDHLTEEIAYEKAVREQRMAQELSAAKRERDFYMSRVDKAKAIAAMEQRQQAKQQQQQQQHEVSACDVISNMEPAAAAAGGTAAGATDDSRGNAAAKANGIKRMYGQRKVKGAPSLLGATEVQDELLQLIVTKKRRGLST